MKILASWLKERLEQTISRETLIDSLTMAGLEVEASESLEGGDYLLDINVTPNRGDCLNITGIARELSAFSDVPEKVFWVPKVFPSIKESLDINVSATEDCPIYRGRVILDVDCNKTLPHWLTHRLVQSGMRLTNPVVDIINYVMLALGQPMHAFDLSKINQAIYVEQLKKQHTLTLLNEKTVSLPEGTLVIRDEKALLAVAGVMGSQDSAVNLTTTAVFVESAFFQPEIIANKARQLNITSEAAYRYERGVDPSLSFIALDYATDLIVTYLGGKPGPIQSKVDQNFSLYKLPIILKLKHINETLGIEVDPRWVEKNLEKISLRLTKCQLTEVNSEQRNHGLLNNNPLEKETQTDCNLVADDYQWEVIPPCHRFDLHQEIDLIEEVARLYGYQEIPKVFPGVKLKPNAQTFSMALDLKRLKNFCSDLGYFETINYSFISEKLHNLFCFEVPPYHLSNPISSEMSVMRASILPGLINTYLYNQARKVSRAKLFELGLCFTQEEDQVKQSLSLGLLWSGLRRPLQWDESKKNVDFFDIKQTALSLLELIGADLEKIIFDADKPPKPLHPTQSAWIKYEKNVVGVLGKLHPEIAESLEIPQPVFLCEISLDVWQGISQRKVFSAISKFPSVQRDIAILVDKSIHVDELFKFFRMTLGEQLVDICLFDVYQDNSIKTSHHSLGFQLTFQHQARTLTDDEVNSLIGQLLTQLKINFGAVLRE